MGDAADLAVEQSLAELDYFEEHGPEKEDGYPDHSPFWGDDWRGGRFQNRTLTCRCCGEPGLKWRKVEGKWRLAKPRGEVHRCPVHPLPEHVPEPGRDRTSGPGSMKRRAVLDFLAWVRKDTHARGFLARVVRCDFAMDGFDVEHRGLTDEEVVELADRWMDEGCPVK